MDQGDKDKEAEEASIEHAEKHLDGSSGEEESGRVVPDEATKTVLDAAGNELTPFSTSAFKQVVRMASGQVSGKLPGLLAYSLSLREEQEGRVFIPQRMNTRPSCRVL